MCAVELLPIVTCSISIHSQNATQYTFEFDKALREEDNPFIMVRPNKNSISLSSC